MGSIIMSPTRELAKQIFDVLKSVGRYHTISAGVLIGGRNDVNLEKECVNSMNILVCTPGRLLQHMNETENFDCSELQVVFLVLITTFIIFSMLFQPILLFLFSLAMRFNLLLSPSSSFLLSSITFHLCCFSSVLFIISGGISWPGNRFWSLMRQIAFLMGHLSMM